MNEARGKGETWKLDLREEGQNSNYEDVGPFFPRSPIEWHFWVEWSIPIYDIIIQLAC